MLIVINMFYAPFVRIFNVFMCSFGLLVFRVFLCVFHVSACKHVRLTCAQ